MRSRNLPILFCGLLLWALGLASAAQAIPFNDLDPSFRSADGTLEYSDFHLQGIDPAQIDVENLSDGLLFSGSSPVIAHCGDLLSFAFSYKVTALDPFMPIGGASLDLESSVQYDSFGITEVLATATVEGSSPTSPPELRLLDTYNIQDTLKQFADEQTFYEPKNEVSVLNTVLISSTETHATWFSSTNRFNVVPEPGTASLLALGLLGLFFQGRRRS